jgi:putative endonuclease
MRLSTLSRELERRAYTAVRAVADRKSPLPPHLITGQRGEDAAYFHLRSLGYTVVARRWRSPRLAGDLDLVAWDGDTLVFFEVKARTARDLIAAQVQVDEYKQIMLRKMASAYLNQIPEPWRAGVPFRFDILSVYLLAVGTEFEHLADAFPRSEPPRRRF